MRRRGVTLIEMVIVIAVSGIIASAGVTVLVPLLSAFYAVPVELNLYTAATDVLKIIFEGDHAAKGLRYASTSTPITDASGDSITYQYRDPDATYKATPRTVEITYDSLNQVIQRSIDGGAGEYIPYTITPTAPIRINALEGSFFQYFDASGTVLTEPITLDQISRVAVAIEADSGTGDIASGGAKARLKTAAYIKTSSALLE